MKNLIILLTVILTFLSCSVKEKPEFLRVDNIKVDDSNSKYITLTADAYFMNPNDISGELKTDEIKVFVNNNQMATVKTESFKVPARKEFSIPLEANVPTDSLLSNKSLSGLLGSLLSQKMKVQYKGQIKYKVLGFSHTYDVDKTENIKIKF
ncbi:LEA type 2 family protein [Oceanihabitans sp. 2_MG-2023]|uniref:LEA type 2 family protein n=1 Tax=Oceanihabitans sp. 2_MG-2023 TaxID=3062661 RepID=UPI0026E365F5|nr:LEA type 2 family protein [Oceanihabitans sp. 2_MG-2023]MDO6597169.1 LEA type 2 family protein [Oceanihabitans sp. 2_MG-2023]